MIDQEEDITMMQQANLIIGGTGLSMGYSVYVFRQAIRLNLTGLIRNVDDGKVRIVCEGEKEAIEEFRRAIRIKDELTEVTDIKIDYGEAGGCYDTFLVALDLRYNGSQMHDWAKISIFPG